MNGVQWQATIMHGESQELIRECPLSIYKNNLLFALIKMKTKQRPQPNGGPSVSEIAVKYFTDCVLLLVHKHFYNENGWPLQTGQG
jgi:hypothetical protein